MVTSVNIYFFILIYVYVSCQTYTAFDLLFPSGWKRCPVCWRNSITCSSWSSRRWKSLLRLMNTTAHITLELWNSPLPPHLRSQSGSRCCKLLGQRSDIRDDYIMCKYKPNTQPSLLTLAIFCCDLVCSFSCSSYLIKCNCVIMSS